MEVQVEKLCKYFNGTPVLRDVTFTAGTGVTCIMAPSGTGKTTLLRILLGLEQPDSGSVNRCRWSAVFQEDRLLEHLDAMENLRFILGSSLDQHRALALLERLGLAGVGTKKVREYSGGMKRRLALARALLAEADALALDEPFTGLDEDTREAAMEYVLNHRRGRTLLFTTHHVEEAKRLGATLIQWQERERNWKVNK